MGLYPAGKQTKEQGPTYAVPNRTSGSPVNVFGVFVMTLWSTSDVVGPVTNVSRLVPHEAGRANAFFHDALEALPISRTIGVQIKVAPGAIQPFLVIRRQLARRRRQG